MKKPVAILLVFIIICSLVSCKDGRRDSTLSLLPEQNTEATDTNQRVYNVCNLVNGNLEDKSFFDSCSSGLAELEEAGRITYISIEMGGAKDDKEAWLTTLYEVSESGKYDLIICGTYQMSEDLKEVATQFPKQKYLIYDDNTYTGECPNVANIVYKQNDIGYIIGVYAACMTTDNHVPKMNPDAVIGFVGGADTPVINDFLYGYILGAKSVNPDIQVDTRYTNDYVNTEDAKRYGLSMINDNKCDIIWGVAGNSGYGVAEAALESGKAWFIGVDSDQEITLPKELSEITLTSGLKNIGKSLIWFFDEWDKGNTYWGDDISLGIAEGGVGIVDDKNFAKYTSDKTLTRVEAALNGILDGSIIVPSAIGDDTNTIQKLREEVRPRR